MRAWSFASSLEVFIHSLDYLNGVPGVFFVVVLRVRVLWKRTVV